VFSPEVIHDVVPSARGAGGRRAYEPDAGDTSVHVEGWEWGTSLKTGRQVGADALRFFIFLNRSCEVVKDESKECVSP
jgi:hypothetical protein